MSRLDQNARRASDLNARPRNLDASSSAATTSAPPTRGRVIYVGTGPGDPDLLTLGAIAALADATAVILDNERQNEILAHPAITLAPNAEVLTLGLSEAGKPLTATGRAKLVLKHTELGSRVVRLVSGDPFWDNAVADEAAACVRGGVDFEVVPGVSSLTAVPEYAGVDLSHSGGVHFASVTDGKFAKVVTAQWGQAPDAGGQHRRLRPAGPGRGGPQRRPRPKMIMSWSPCTAAAPSSSACPRR